MTVDVWTLFAFALKVLPDIIKLALLAATKIKEKRRPTDKE